MRTLSAASLLLLLASAVPGEAAAQQFSSGAITFQRSLNPKLQRIVTQSTTNAASLAAIATGVSAGTPYNFGGMFSVLNSFQNLPCYTCAYASHRPSSDSAGLTATAGGMIAKPPILSPDLAGPRPIPARPGPTPGAEPDAGAAAGAESTRARQSEAPADVGSAGLGSQLVGRLDAREAASAMGAEPSVSRAELAPGAAAPGTGAPPADEPVTLLVMVGGRGLAADADLGRGTPLSGATPNVFCTAHAVAVGAGIDPGVTQYFAPRHYCR